MKMTRRLLIQSVATAALLPLDAWAAWPEVVVHKDPNCGCCSGWVKHLESNGFRVQVLDTAELDRVKTRLRVPSDLAACHTAEVENYVIEGHVPAAVLQRFLTERPQALGLSVSGMPSGSLGMGGEPEQYEVTLFGPNGRRVYARFEGEQEL